MRNHRTMGTSADSTSHTRQDPDAVQNLDVLQRRQPFYDDSAAVMAAAEHGRLRGLVAAHSVTTLFYLLSKYGGAVQARVTTLELLSVLAVAAVDGHVLAQALALPYRDLEDAVQMAAAREAGADYVVTLSLIHI